MTNPGDDPTVLRILLRVDASTMKIGRRVRSRLARQQVGDPFSMLSFDDPDLPDVASVEQVTSARYLTREGVDRCAQAMRCSTSTVSPRPHPPTASAGLSWRSDMDEIRNGMPASELHGVTWKKSTWSNSQGNCVELAALADGGVAIRNSRHPSGPALIYTRAEIDALLRGVKDGEFDGLT